MTFVVSAPHRLLAVRAAWAAARARALLAGAAFAFSPSAPTSSRHLSTLGTQWLPLVVLFLFRFFRDGRARDALLARDVLRALRRLACGYHGVIGLLVLPLAAVPWCGAAGQGCPWRRWRAALAGLALTSLVSCCIARPWSPGVRARARRDDAVLGAPRGLPGHAARGIASGARPRRRCRATDPTTCSPGWCCPGWRSRGRSGSGVTDAGPRARRSASRCSRWPRRRWRWVPRSRCSGRRWPRGPSPSRARSRSSA